MLRIIFNKNRNLRSEGTFYNRRLRGRLNQSELAKKNLHRLNSPSISIQNIVRIIAKVVPLI